MSPLARRLVLAAVIVIFCGLSATILIVAGGWRYDRGQIVRGAGLFIDSRPRATVFSDGQEIGTTPFRSTTFNPSHRQIKLVRPGYHDWSTTVDLEAGRSVSIATVRLFPVIKPARVATMTENEAVLIDEAGQSPWAISTAADKTYIQAINATGWNNKFAVPFVPIKIIVSDDGKYVYLKGENQAGVLNQAGVFWPTPLLSWATWSPDHTAVLFGVHDGHLNRIDVFTQSIESGDAVTSLVRANNQLWGTSSDSNQTILWRRDPTAQAAAQTVKVINGTVTLLANNDGELVIVNNGFGQHISGRPTTGYVFESLGTVTAILAGGTVPLTWTNGVEVWYLSGGRSILVDRFTSAPIWAGWYHLPDTVAVSDGKSITVYDQISANGHTIVARDELPAATVWLNKNSDGRGFLFRSGQTLYRWSW